LAAGRRAGGLPRVRSRPGGARAGTAGRMGAPSDCGHATFPEWIVGGVALDRGVAQTKPSRLMPIFKMNFPEIVDLALPAEGVFHNLVWSGGSTRDSRVGFGVSPKPFVWPEEVSGETPATAGGTPALPYKIMHGLWGMGQMMFTKYLVVVDDDVDVHNTSEVLFRLCANTDPQRDSLFTKGPSDVLDHATSEVASGSKLGLDATKKIPGEGFKRPWPPLIKMDDAVKQKIDQLFNR